MPHRSAGAHLDERRFGTDSVKYLGQSLVILAGVFVLLNRSASC